MFGNKYLWFNQPARGTQEKFGWHRQRGHEVTLINELDYEDTSSTVPTPATSSIVPTRVTIKRREINFITADDYYHQPTTEMEHEKPIVVDKEFNITKMEHKKPTVNMKEFNKNCPETERPVSLGTYEIPTQRDLVLFTQRTLMSMFNSYHEKTLLLLKDIKEATRATAATEKMCHGRGKGLIYKQCVNRVNKKFVTVTKGLVKTLEDQEAEVIALTEGKICNLSSMKTNPILLIKILAMDEAALTFALPAFLRLLGGCSVHCNKPAAPDHRPRLRKMTDQELVIRHFLTNKNYYDLLKDKTYV